MVETDSEPTLFRIARLGVARLPGDLDTSHLRVARAESHDRHRYGRNCRRRLSARLALDRRCHPELREARRCARHMAGVAFQVADPHVLVWCPVGLSVYGLRRAHVRVRTL